MQNNYFRSDSTCYSIYLSFSRRELCLSAQGFHFLLNNFNHLYQNQQEGIDIKKKNKSCLLHKQKSFCQSKGLSVIFSFSFKNRFPSKQKMISKSSSGILQPKVSFENITSSLNQKDKMIELLQRELKSFKTLRQDYDRMKDRKVQVLDKCDAVQREINLCKDSQNRKTSSDSSMIQDLGNKASNLHNQLQNKNYHLKGLKCQTQTLLASKEQREGDLTHCLDSIERVKATTDTIKMEKDRLKVQLNQTKSQIDRVRHTCNQTVGSWDQIKNQIHNMESYIRNLHLEEDKVGEKLSTLEDQNNAIDTLIEELSSLVQMTTMKTKEIQQNKNDLECQIKAKKIEKGRIEKEYAERHKLFKTEREKQRKVKEQIESKMAEIQKLTFMNKDVSEETQDIVTRNLEVEDINAQLKADLEVCKRHLENVSRTNYSVNDELQGYKKVNRIVIKKLEKPLDEGWSELNQCRKSQFAESTTENFQFIRH